MSGQIHGRKAILDYTTAGKATITLLTPGLGRFTYRIRRIEEGRDFWFVDVLTGSDNNEDYTFLGSLDRYRPLPDPTFKVSPKSKIGERSPSAGAFAWFWAHLEADALGGAEVYHEGRCGRCGRKLTVPESIDTGLGPECAAKLAA